MTTVAEAFAQALRHHQAGELVPAEKLYRLILQADAGHADALHLLGVLAHQAGQHLAALDLIQQAITLNPAEAVYHANLGLVNQALRQLNKAAASFRQAIRLRPDFGEPHSNLGNVLREQGKVDEAVLCCEEALRLRPDLAEAHLNLGAALQKLGRLDEAVASYRHALHCRPNYAEAHNDLGSALRELGQMEEAVIHCRKAILLRPDYAFAHNNLGAALREQGHLSNAVASCRQALRLRPDYAEAHNNLGLALHCLGQPEEAQACYRRALEFDPRFARAHSNLLWTEHYRPEVTSAGLARLHVDWDRQHALPLQSSWKCHANSLAVGRPLRLGFLSPDFGNHPVGIFLIRALENLDRCAFEIVCYNDRVLRDAMTARFTAVAARRVDVVGWSDDRLAEQIRTDGIDLLFDLAGHTAGGNRLLVFARKPAPVQIAWIGYEGTTGLAAIDYLLADDQAIPSGTQADYVEKVVRLPDSYICYDPPADAPTINSLPAMERGYVTFGCFNNPTKITTSVLDVWAKILCRLPQARLVLKYKGMDDPANVRRISAVWRAHGLDPGRIDLRGWSPYGEYLAEYGGIDLALDPFPFSGGVTTCAALWMGVPVITCPGETLASRHTLSYLSAIGETGTIARDLEEYEALAVQWAQDWGRLAELRGRLRERMASSPLCDGPRIARHLEQAFRTMWERHVAGKSPHAFAVEST
jgi:predicted O-linked N-acetylglucosamine transferase (SPINDLY family)